ncbi:MAG: NPCBM/NEW2 domain-containing protein [Sedimentisphaerales bacterium]|nr:NPCBM/NEW2 domain-containing protein [Sedimentisphaerales bacterium]
MKSGLMWCGVAVLMSVLSCRAAGESQERVWLSDLDCQWVQQQWGKPQKDRSVEGRPLRMDGRVYTHGLGVHANTAFTVDVRGCRRFEGLVGVDDEVSAHPSSAGCTIRGDGKVLWKSELLKADQKPQAFAMDLSGIDYIEVLIDDAGDGNNSDHVDIVDAFFLCDGTAPAIVAPLPPPSRWQPGDSCDIRWRVSEDTRLPHHDFVEMSGQQVSLVLYYDIDANRHLTLKRKLVWPMLRTIPNDTHASLIHDFGNALSFAIQDSSGSVLPEMIEECRFNGVFQSFGKTQSGLEIRRTLFPSMTGAMAVEQVVIRNITDKAVTLSIQAPSYEHRTDPKKGVYGQYILDVTAQYKPNVTLEAGQDCTLALGFRGRKADDKPGPLNAGKELKDRLALIATVQQNLVFECPDEIINRTFELAKIRAADSVFQTRGGLMFAPGGERYYAAIWANDNAEYQGPFAPFQGEASANEAALNAYRHFARFMNDAYKPIPSSIIAEGTDIWNGAGDRGDAAMIAYGASRYAMALGDKQTARELWPLIAWCLEYCKRKTTPEGVIASDCDELEHRFPAGKANLCTATLNYDALRSAVMLGAALGVDSKQLQDYAARAKALRASIAAYFSATVEGYETWQYYQGNDKLRSWICVPFVMGMDERKEGTIEALFSPQLWTPDGLATQSGDKTFWDRSTLYALRGVFCSGRTDLALEKMHAYSKRRLLGEHVPYPVEAYPEGGQRHLAAESALYCRIVTEGLFGIRPAGLKQFECSPRLPADWTQMSLRHIRAFGEDFDIAAQKTPDKTIKIKVSSHNKIVTEQLWDGQQPVLVHLKN